MPSLHGSVSGEEHRERAQQAVLHRTCLSQLRLLSVVVVNLLINQACLINNFIVLPVLLNTFAQI
jgi:hypothetical protein